MKKLPQYFFAVIFFLSAIQHLSAQSNTLLWRISGNGLKKPSFLFGTMHVNDKTAFNFTDSLYAALDQVQAFASELNGDSATQILGAFFNGDIITENDSTLMRAILRGRMKNLYTKIAAIDSSVSNDSVLSEKPIQGNTENNFMNSLPGTKKMMNTFMDAYLYQVAYSKMKKIYGLENIYDQAKVAGALSTGFKLNDLDSIVEKWKIVYRSPIYALYSRENLDSLNLFYTDFYTEAALETFLYKRNRKMAHVMDSLMHLQTLFTAVGAGHLPGKKGLIEILKGMGYSVTPVFSSNRIPPLKIEPTTRGIWNQVSNTHYGFIYEMPGKADSIIEEKGKLLLYHYDIGAGYVYIIRSGTLTSVERKKNTDDVIRQQLTDLTRLMNGFLVSRKFTELKNHHGMEMLMNIGSETVYRVKEFIDGNMYYIIELGGEKKEMLFTENAERYFNSFDMISSSGEVAVETKSDIDGFRVQFPGNPAISNTRLDEKTSSELQMKNYTYLDTHSGINYTLIDFKSVNNHTLNDSKSMFDDYQERLTKNELKADIQVSDTTVQGYPARKYILKRAQGERKQSIMVKRDNFGYYIIAEYDSVNANNPAISQFFSSFVLTPFKKANWEYKQSPDKSFSTWMPSQINEEEIDSTSYDFTGGVRRYYATDPFASVNYSIERDTISKYFWAANADSVYSSFKKNEVNSWRDSLISYKDVVNGKMISKELVIVNKLDSSLTKKRMVLNGHSMYILTVKWPRLYPDETNMNKFLSSFHITHEQSSDWIFSNSSALLFKDLHSFDSATFSEAFNAIDIVKFGNDDLHELLKESADSFSYKANQYYSVSNKLIREIKTILDQDKAGKMRQYVSDYIEQNYLTAKKSSIRFEWLGLLAENKTEESYGLIKTLLSKQLPEGEESYNFYNNLADSLGLTKNLFPDMLNYLSDSSNAMGVVRLSDQLLDSSMLSLETVKAKETEFLQIAGRELSKLTKPDEDGNYDYDYRVTYLISLLEKINDKRANEMLKKYLKAGEPYLRQQAAIALVKNGQSVNSSVFTSLANDIEQRISLYSDLKKEGKLKLFPSAFNNQQSMAEAYIYQSIDDDDEYDTKPEYIYIKTIDYEYKGQLRRFYLFRINFYNTNDVDADSEISERENYLAIAGPFDLNEKNSEINEDDNITGLYYNEKFGSEENEVLFKKYIQQVLKGDE